MRFAGGCCQVPGSIYQLPLLGWRDSLKTLEDLFQGHHALTKIALPITRLSLSRICFFSSPSAVIQSMR
jgi:hypothetical protein